jgi:hypothetical protein
MLAAIVRLRTMSRSTRVAAGSGPVGDSDAMVGGPEDGGGLSPLCFVDQAMIRETTIKRNREAKVGELLQNELHNRIWRWWIAEIISNFEMVRWPRG